MRSIAVLVLTASFAVTSSVIAQAPLPPVGARVRVETGTGARVVGTVVPAGADTLRLVIGPGEELTAPQEALRGYELSAGPNRGAGAFQGALVGGALGLVLIGAALYVDATAEDAIIPAIAYATPVVVGVTLIGAGIGAIAAPEKWDTPIMLGVGRQPRGDGEVGADLTLSFGVSLPATLLRWGR